jgi:hypothetical protein
VAVARAVARPLVVARVTAPKALLLIEDSAGGEQPLTIPGRLVAATPTSVAVGCAANGPTEVAVGDLGLAPRHAKVPAFDGRLSTPSRKLAVRTILGATLLEVTVPSTDTSLRVWTNAATDPTEITIAVDRAAAGIAR